MATTTPSSMKTDEAAAIAERAASTYLLNPRVGYKTTELWLTLLTLLDDLLLTRYGHDWGLAGNLPTVAAIVSSLLSATYVTARTWLKAKHVQATTAKDAGHADSMLLLLVAVLVLLLALGVVPR